MKFQVAAGILATALLGGDVSLCTSAFSFVPQRSSVVVTPSKGISNNDGHHIRRSRSSSSSSLVMKDDNSKFSFANLFSGEGAASAPTRVRSGGGNSATLEPHPSQRDHINPLNALYPPNKRAIEESAGTAPSPPLPFHPAVQSGVLSNGFSYVFLPNRSPPNRFEAHLQVFSGSSDELEPQQGIAHLTEHVAYMGSRKRERLFGTGSQTNAYTDFHHTVFYAACPTYSPNGGSFGSPQPMLPMALDALCDVMEARCDPSRIEKERQAVLSEMTMVNTIEYRVECQILSTLHRENRLAKRFPIGKESLIQKWNRDDVKTWHRTHYRPDNVLLYVVGDLDPEYVQQTIEDKFGHLSAEKQGSEIALTELKGEASDLADAVVGGTLKQRQSWHYPPVRHDFCVLEGVKDLLNDGTKLVETGDLEVVEKKSEDESSIGSIYDIHLQQPYALDDKVQFLKEAELSPGKVIRPHIFKHELLQNFSFHLFAKRPVEPIKDMKSFRRSLARRVCLAALQIRLNVGGRSDDPAFTFVEFNQLDSAREGCAVCSLDMTADPPRWREAVLKSISEIRKLGIHGVTPGEMERYASALLTDAEQLAAQGDMISHGDQLAYLMETVANGHTFMSPEQSYAVTEQALSTLTLEEVNRAAAELCSHITGLNDGELTSTGMVVAVACTPRSSDNDGASFVDEDLLCQAIRDACSIEVEPVEDVVVPHTLVTPEELEEAMKANPPKWESGQFSDGTPNTPADRITRPFTLRRLGNGIRVGINQNAAESQRGHLRLVAPGGRDAERRLGFKSGSLAVGARAMQEGGSFGSFSREQVELFAVDHLIMVEINCNEESLVMDFVFPTTNVGNSGYGENMKLGITGTEAVLQIVREILIDFNWEEDALGRSKSSYRTAHESLGKSLEGKSTEMVMDAVTSGDERFLSIDVDTVNAVTLEDAKNAVMSQLRPKDLEISVSGDFVVNDVLEQILQYLGTVPADTNAEYEVKDASMEFASVPKLSLPGKHLDLELEDSDPRAVAYVAGAAPNQWGFLADGTSVAQRVSEADKRASDYDKQRRAHPLFGNAALSLISEIANRRLFSTVRERKQLTYDANFSLTGFERMKGGWFLVTVTASKEKAQRALDACKETLEALRKSNPISVDNLESAKRVVLNRHEGELRTSQYWATIMSGIQEESIPLKGPLSVTDFHAVIEAMTVKDLQLALDCMGLEESELYTAIGKTVQPEGLVVDDIVKASPMAGMGRGGALTG
jgi:predicted Zn-dependent peptidase